MPKRGSFNGEKKIKFDHPLVFSCLHHLFPNRTPLTFYFSIISLTWPFAFFSTRAPLLPHPSQFPGQLCQWIMWA